MSKTCLHIHTVFAEDLKMDQEYLVPSSSQAREAVQVLLAVLRS